jgi:hypothetical protein
MKTQKITNESLLVEEEQIFRKEKKTGSRMIREKKHE